jgi:hypothetical protein
MSLPESEEGGLSIISLQFEDADWEIRICKSKDGQHSGKKKKDHDLQNITHKINIIKNSVFFTCCFQLRRQIFLAQLTPRVCHISAV